MGGMLAIFVFALTLLAAVLVSELANRSVLSTAVMFLVAGFIAGHGVLGLYALKADDTIVASFAELALFSVLFTDGMRVSTRDLLAAWHLPGRALLFGLPLTLLITAALAHWLVGLPWPLAFLLGAALSPTDPVFAAAIVGREEVPGRLRQLLNIESGLNDGLALPIVIALLARVGAPQEFHLEAMLSELTLGIGIGVVVPWVAIVMERSPFFKAHRIYEPLHAFAMGLLILSLSWMLRGNEFLAAFSGGVAVATLGPSVRDSFHPFGERLTELLKLAALLVFGSLISPGMLEVIPPRGYLFTLLALVVARPVALALALLGSGLARREWVAAAWFGPKGFASVFFGLLILQSGAPRAEELFRLIALVITASILAHSSTDVPIAHWLQKEEPDP
ncbi:MAG: cation:proton antiporter, partial [Isosphaeraceae bacterium]|nr:cation:proton antiporter [Isosphaeraceae bacterium]